MNFIQKNSVKSIMKKVIPSDRWSHKGYPVVTMDIINQLIFKQ